MRLAILAVPFALAACADGAVMTPGDVFGRESVAAKVAQFCAPDFTAQPTAALGEWLALANAVLVASGSEPLDATEYTESDAVATLLAVRAAVCAAAPAE